MPHYRTETPRAGKPHIDQRRGVWRWFGPAPVETSAWEALMSFVRHLNHIEVDPGWWLDRRGG